MFYCRAWQDYFRHGSLDDVWQVVEARGAKEKEKRQQMLKDPIIKDDEEIRIKTEKEDKNKDKDRDQPNSVKKKDKENRRTDDKK